jgi:hypothetical protein
MSAPRFAHLTFSATTILLVGAARGPLLAASELVFDVGPNGPLSSRVEECLGSGACYDYPIIGKLGLTLGPQTPQLRNIDSLLQQAPAPAPLDPASEFAWHHFELLVGGYQSDPNLDDLTIAFYAMPVIDPSEPLFPLLLTLSDGRTKLTLTGGGDFTPANEKKAASVAFSINGRLVPEPGAALLVFVGVICCLANRGRR